MGAALKDTIIKHPYVVCAEVIDSDGTPYQNVYVIHAQNERSAVAQVIDGWRFIDGWKPCTVRVWQVREETSYNWELSGTTVTGETRRLLV